jgi:predicted Co/Zn/Cd cation transporter (cation efflux family)
VNKKLEKNDPLFFRVGPYANSDASAGYEDSVEKHILRVSFYATIFFAVLGLTWGALIKSQMLIFDGIYSFVSLVMTGLFVYVAQLMRIRNDEKFPFGQSQMEPMVIVLKALVIIVVCISAFTKAMVSLLSGGRQINAFSAMIYCFLGIAGCLASWLYIIWKGKKSRLSGLVQAEGRQWFLDMLISIILFFGFFTAHTIQHTEHAYYARYIDSLMVIIASLFFSLAPIISLVEGIKNMLHMAPGEDVYRVSRQVMEDIAKKLGFDGFVLRIAKSGRELVYEIGFVSDNPKNKRSIGELDNIRQEVENRLKAFYDNPILLDISFMHDKKWG